MSYQVRNAKRAQGHNPQTPRWQVDRDTERGAVFNVPGYTAREHFNTLSVLQGYCEMNNIQLEYASEYGEPGYTNPKKGILFANWNDIPETLQKRLEAQGFELEWSDEWYVDSDNSPAKAWRTEPDGYGWEPSVRDTDNGTLTPDDEPEEWIDSSLNDRNTPLPSWFNDSDLRLLGFELSNERHDASNPLRNVPRDLENEGFDFVLKSTRSREYEVWTRREAERGVLFDSASGVYIPQRFAQEIDRDKCDIPGFTDEDWVILEQGPEQELYWDVWQEVLDKCTCTFDGKQHRLEQDGDVFYVEAGAEYCERLDKYFFHKE